MSFEEVFHLSLKQLSLIIGGGALGHAAGCSDPVVPLHCCSVPISYPRHRGVGTRAPCPSCLLGEVLPLQTHGALPTAWSPSQQAWRLVSSIGPWQAFGPDLIVWLYFPTSETLPEVVRGFGPPGSQLLLTQPSLPAPWARSSLAASRGQALRALWGGKLHLTLWCPHSLPFCIPLFQSCPLHFQSVASSHSPLAVPAALMFLASFRLSPLLSLPPPSPRDVALPFSICPIVSPLFIWVLELQVLSFSATAQNVSHRLCGWIITRYRTTWGFPAKPPSPPVRGGDRISEITFSVVVVVVVLKGRKPGEKLGSSSFGNTRW